MFRRSNTDGKSNLEAIIKKNERAIETLTNEVRKAEKRSDEPRISKLRYQIEQAEIELTDLQRQLSEAELNVEQVKYDFEQQDQVVRLSDKWKNNRHYDPIGGGSPLLISLNDKDKAILMAILVGFFLTFLFLFLGGQ